MSIHSLSVVIPTYQRPVWLRRAIHSLVQQLQPPTEVIAIARDVDIPTHDAICALQAEGLPFPVRSGIVTEAGFIPPVRKGFALARGDIVAVMDDDAEALHDWAQQLLRHYADPTVGGVGGRAINMEGDQAAPVPDADRVGYVSFLGRFVGNMYKRPTFSHPVDVDFLMGGCMSFRRAVAQTIEFDLALNNNVAFAYEVDVGLQVRARGWRLVFDPTVAIRHYSAPRQLDGMRSLNDGESARWCSYNETRIVLRRLPRHASTVALLWSVLVGARRTPGLLPWLLAPLGRLAGYRLSLARPAIAGRIAAVRSVWRDARATTRPNGHPR
jgi:GT2 family glycosyltransferase